MPSQRSTTTQSTTGTRTSRGRRFVDPNVPLRRTIRQHTRRPRDDESSVTPLTQRQRPLTIAIDSEQSDDSSSTEMIVSPTHSDEISIPCAQPSGRRSSSPTFRRFDATSYPYVSPSRRHSVSPKITALVPVEYSNERLSDITSRLVHLQGPYASLPSAFPNPLPQLRLRRPAALLVGIQVQSSVSSFIERDLLVECSPLLHEVFAQIKKDSALSKALENIISQSNMTVFTGTEHWEAGAQAFNGTNKYDYRSMALEPIAKLSNVMDDAHSPTDVRLQPCPLSVRLLEWRRQESLQGCLIFTVYIIDDISAIGGDPTPPTQSPLRAQHAACPPDAQESAHASTASNDNLTPVHGSDARAYLTRLYPMHAASIATLLDQDYPEGAYKTCIRVRIYKSVLSDLPADAPVSEQDVWRWLGVRTLKTWQKMNTRFNSSMSIFTWLKSRHDLDEQDLPSFELFKVLVEGPLKPFPAAMGEPEGSYPQAIYDAQYYPGIKFDQFLKSYKQRVKATL